MSSGNLKKQSRNEGYESLSRDTPARTYWSIAYGLVWMMWNYIRYDRLARKVVMDAKLTREETRLFGLFHDSLYSLQESCADHHALLLKKTWELNALAVEFERFGEVEFTDYEPVMTQIRRTKRGEDAQRLLDCIKRLHEENYPPVALQRLPEMCIEPRKRVVRVNRLANLP